MFKRYVVAVQNDMVKKIAWKNVIMVSLIIFIATLVVYSISGDFNFSIGLGALLLSWLWPFISFSFAADAIDKKEEIKIKEVERKIEENPERTKNTWDLARIKLESYLNRNLMQVRLIFYLTVIIMMVGFIIIGYGIIKVYDKPDNLQASILVTCSGILVNFIGATFLLIYQSTMAQAKEYVSVLERINAVGMSIQILENIKDDESKLKNETSADLAKELLKLYGNK